MIIIILVMWSLSYMMEFNEIKSNQLMQQYECGFEPILWTKISPSLHFSKIGLIFITFDLEMLFIISMFNTTNWMKMTIILLFISLTLWMEFEMKSLSWSQ